MAKNQLVSVDLFSGCGGLSLGLEQAGFEPILFSELNPSAAETYIANRPGTRHLWVPDVYDLAKNPSDRKHKPKSDIHKVWAPEWEKRGINDVDVLCGG